MKRLLAALAFAFLATTAFATQFVTFNASVSAGYEFSSPVAYSPAVFLPYGGQAHNLHCKFTTPDSYGPWRVTLRKNGVDTSTTCWLSRPSPKCSDNHYAGFAVEDTMDAKIEFVGQGPGAAVLACGYQFD